MHSCMIEPFYELLNAEIWLMHSCMIEPFCELLNAAIWLTHSSIIEPFYELLNAEIWLMHYHIIEPFYELLNAEIDLHCCCLDRFSQAAMAKFDDIKEQSTTGIQHALEQHSYTEISLNLMSSYVLIPEGGLMTP